MNPVPQRFLDGFHAGQKARALDHRAPADGSGSGSAANGADSTAADATVGHDERGTHPLAAFPRLLEGAAADRPPAAADARLWEWFGVFDLATDEGRDGCAVRVRLPAGRLRSFQLRELAALTQEAASGCVGLAPGGGLELRVVPWRDAPGLLRRLRAAGLETLGAGGSTLRPLAISPAAGLDLGEIFDTTDVAWQLEQLVATGADRDLLNLPHPLRIALDGGGDGLFPPAAGFGTAEIDACLRAVRPAGSGPASLPVSGVRLEVRLAGASRGGAGDDAPGVLIDPAQAVRFCVALARTFRRLGQGGAGFSTLVATQGANAILAHLETEDPDLRLHRTERRRSAETPPAVADAAAARTMATTTVLVVEDFPMRDRPEHCVLLAGTSEHRLLTSQLLALAALSETHADGELRLAPADAGLLLLLPGVAKNRADAARAALAATGLVPSGAATSRRLPDAPVSATFAPA